MQFSSSLLLSQAPVSLYAKDLNGIYIWCNNYLLQLLNKKSTDDIIGKKDRELFTLSEANTFRSNDIMVMSVNDDRRIIESFFNGKEQITVFSHKRPFKNDLGIVIGVFGSSTDITCQKKIEDFLTRV